VLHAARWKYRTQKCHKKSSYAHHCTTLLSCFFAMKAYIDNQKNLLNNNTSSTCLHSMTNFGPLTAETDWRVWGMPANFNRLLVLASLPQRYRSVDVNQTLHNVWPSAGLVHYIYIFGGSCLLTEFCHVQKHFASKSCIFLYWQRYRVSQALRHGTRNGAKELL